MTRVKLDQDGRSSLEIVATVASTATLKATAGGRAVTRVQLLLRATHSRSVPSIVPTQIEAPYVTSDERPREPWLSSQDRDHDSERQEAVVDHLSKIDDYIVVDSRAAASAAPKTFAAHCPMKQARQLTLRPAERHTKARHTMVIAQCRGSWKEETSCIPVLPSQTQVDL